MWLIVAAGTASVLYAAYTLPTGIIDGYFLLLTLITAVLGSRIAIRIPQISGNITLEDTFVFIALLLYGGEAAVMIGALAGICSALRISRKVRTVAFGSASLACSVFTTATVLKADFRFHNQPDEQWDLTCDHRPLCDGHGPIPGPHRNRLYCECAQDKPTALVHVEPQLPLDLDQLFCRCCGRWIYREQSWHVSVLGVPRLHSDHRHRLLQLRPLHARSEGFGAIR